MSWSFTVAPCGVCCRYQRSPERPTLPGTPLELAFDDARHRSPGVTFERILRVIAGLSALFGVGFALVPAAVFGPYGVSLDQSGTFVARLFGGQY